MPQKKKKVTTSLQDFQSGSGLGSWADSAEEDSFGTNDRMGDDNRDDDRGGRFGGDRGGRYGDDRGGRYGDDRGDRGDRGGRFGGGWGENRGGDRGGRYGDDRGDGGRYGGGGRYGDDRGGRYGGGGRYGDDRGDRGGRYGGDRREQRPQKEAPQEPPFIAFLGNLPFDIKDFEIGEFFEEKLQCKISNIRLPEDHSGRPRGYGYVTFEDRESLVNALGLQGERVFGGRNLKVDVAEERQQRDQPISKADQVDRWERGKKVPQRENNNDRYNRRGGGNRRGGYNRGGFDRGFDQDRQERPKLNLKPRSADSSGNSNSRSKSIFGDAKPRDESAYQKKKGNENKSNGEQNQKEEKSDAPTPAPAQAKKETTADTDASNRFAALSIDDK